MPRHTKSTNPDAGPAELRRLLSLNPDGGPPSKPQTSRAKREGAKRRARTHVATDAEIQQAAQDAAVETIVNADLGPILDVAPIDLGEALTKVAIDATPTNLANALAALDVKIAGLTPGQVADKALADAKAADEARYEPLDEPKPRPAAPAPKAVRPTSNLPFVVPEGKFVYMVRPRGQKNDLGLSIGADYVEAIANAQDAFPGLTLACERMTLSKATSFLDRGLRLLVPAEVA